MQATEHCKQLMIGPTDGKREVIKEEKKGIDSESKRQQIEIKKAMDLVPTTVADFFQHYREGATAAKLQSVLTYAIEQRVRDSIHSLHILNSSNNISKSVRLQASAARRASYWLTQHPSDPNFIMADDDMKLGSEGCWVSQ